MTSTKPKWSRCFFCSTPLTWENGQKTSEVISSANYENNVLTILKHLLNESGRKSSSLKKKIVTYLNNEDGKASPLATLCTSCGDSGEIVREMTLEMEVLQMKISYWMTLLKKKIVQNSRRHGDNLEIKEEFDEIEKGLSEREANGYSCGMERAFLKDLEDFQNAVHKPGIALCPIVNVERLPEKVMPSLSRKSWKSGKSLKVPGDDLINEGITAILPKQKSEHVVVVDLHSDDDEMNSFEDDHFFENDTAPCSPVPLLRKNIKSKIRKVVQTTKKADTDCRNMKKLEFKHCEDDKDIIYKDTLEDALNGNIDEDIEKGNSNEDNEKKVSISHSSVKIRRSKRLVMNAKSIISKSQQLTPKENRNKSAAEFTQDEDNHNDQQNSDFNDSQSSSDDTDFNELKVSRKSKAKKRRPRKKMIKRFNPRSLKSLTLQALLKYKIKIPNDANNPLRPVCDQCGFKKGSSKSLASLERHLEEHETNIKAHQCSYCERNFSQRQLFDLHVYRHGMRNQCDICSKYFSPYEISHHIESKHGNVFPCLWCSNSYGDFGNLVQHASCHSEAMLKCALCPEKDSLELSVKDSLPRHLYEHHEMKNMLYPCKVHSCSKICWSRFSLYRHFQNHQKQQRRLKGYSCNLCEKIFRGRNTFLKHQIENHDYPKFKCGLCPAEFSSNLSLKHHRKIVHEMMARKFQCTKCKKGFNSSSNLYEHKEIHLTTKVVCEICGHQASTTNTLRNHKKAFHSDVGKPHECTQCSKKFSRRWCLDVHMRTHTKEKPYQCEECGATFAQRSTLATHLKVHLNN